MQFNGERAYFGSEFKGRVHQGREVKTTVVIMDGAGQFPFSTYVFRISAKESHHLQRKSLPPQLTESR